MGPSTKERAKKVHEELLLTRGATLSIITAIDFDISARSPRTTPPDFAGGKKETDRSQSLVTRTSSQSTEAEMAEGDAQVSLPEPSSNVETHAAETGEGAVSAEAQVASKDAPHAQQSPASAPPAPLPPAGESAVSETTSGEVKGIVEGVEVDTGTEFAPDHSSSSGSTSAAAPAPAPASAINGQAATETDATVKLEQSQVGNASESTETKDQTPTTTSETENGVKKDEVLSSIDALISEAAAAGAQQPPQCRSDELLSGPVEGEQASNPPGPSGSPPRQFSPSGSSQGSRTAAGGRAGEPGSGPQQDRERGRRGGKGSDRQQRGRFGGPIQQQAQYTGVSRSELANASSLVSEQ